MKAFKLKQPLDNYPEGKLFYGPLPVLSGTVKGYYPEEGLGGVPGTDAYFESYVLGHSEYFEPMGEVDDPRKKDSNE